MPASCHVQTIRPTLLHSRCILSPRPFAESAPPRTPRVEEYSRGGEKSVRVRDFIGSARGKKTRFGVWEEEENSWRKMGRLDPVSIPRIYERSRGEKVEGGGDNIVKGIEIHSIPFGKWKKFRIVVSFQGIGYRWDHVCVSRLLKLVCKKCLDRVRGFWKRVSLVIWEKNNEKTIKFERRCIIDYYFRCSIPFTRYAYENLEIEETLKNCRGF